MSTTRCVRGADYATVRVDVAAKEVTLGAAVAQGGSSTVYRGTFAGRPVAVKKPKLATRVDMDRYHRELQLLRRASSPTSRPRRCRSRARSSFDHPNVCGLVAARAWPPEYYLLFPFMARPHPAFCARRR